MEREPVFAALERAARVTRLRLVPGTPERYPATPVVVMLLHLEAALGVLRLSRATADALTSAAQRNEQFEAELTAWDVPVNALVAALERCEYGDGNSHSRAEET